MLGLKSEVVPESVGATFSFWGSQFLLHFKVLSREIKFYENHLPLLDNRVFEKTKNCPVFMSREAVCLKQCNKLI